MMDFLDPKKKRAHRTRLFIGYGLMAVAIGIATTIIAFEAFGFGLDRRTGTVIQNGLLFIDTHPESADITLNGVSKGQTDARMVIPEGLYNMELKRDGYRDWKRSFQLLGSTIERLVYPFLFPSSIDREDVELYADVPPFSTQSPDRKWVMVQHPGEFTSFDVYDTGQVSPAPGEITFEQALFTDLSTGRHSLELVEWSNDNRHVLIKHTFTGGNEFVMLDRDTPAESVNVNRRLDVTIAQVSLRDKEADALYLTTKVGASLQLASLEAASVTPIPGVNAVLAHKSYSTEEILFVTTEGAEKDKVLVKVRTANAVHTLRELPAGDPNYLVEISKYDGSWYLAAGASGEKKAYVYKDPFDVFNRTVGSRIPIPETLLKTDEVGRALSFSANTRFLALQGGNQFAVYDVDLDRLHRFNTKLPIADTEKARWMDGHRLTFISERKLEVVDYEGSNLQELVGVNGSNQPYFDRDYDRLFTLGPSVVVPERTALVLAHMRTAGDR